MVDYRVQVRDSTGSNFGPGNLIAEFREAVNIGWGEYLNDVPEAFFTISQDDPNITVLRAHRNKAHIRIIRDGTTVWGGILGEWSANERDAIFYGYGYSALLHLIVTDWNVAYSSTQINVIVDDAFDRAKSDLTSTLSGWLTKGTIEAPVTTSGGATPIVLPSYRMFHKRILAVMQEMAAIAIGDTTNVVTFEVTPTGTFNFWKNRGSDVAVDWRYPEQIQSFDEGAIPILRRNDLFGVGINPNDITLRDNETSPSDITTNGRRQEPLFFPWVRDSLELERVLLLRLSRAVREDIEIPIILFPGATVPPRTPTSTWGLGDRVGVRMNRGVTSINTRLMVAGYQVIYVRGVERIRPILQERPGT